MNNNKFSKLPPLTTPTLNVKWSNLLKPDVAFGESSANHNITVVVDVELKTILDSLLVKSGCKKINGLKEQDGVLMLKAKSKVNVDKGRYPCVDSASTTTDAVPFGGDSVRLKLQPIVLTRDNSLSFYLNGIQIVTKELRQTNSSNGFSVVENGFVSTAPSTVVVDVEDEELPF